MFDIDQRIKSATDNPSYKQYLQVKDWVIDLINNLQSKGFQESAYWEEEIEGFDYMLDASPLIVSKLREHCYHITGIKSYDYRNHHDAGKEPFFEKLKMLSEVGNPDLFVPEPDYLGGFGHEQDGKMINVDTLKFYESFIAMDKAGILEEIFSSDSRKTILEIGGGWGGLAYQFKTLNKNNSYIIVDLPHTFIFSATYLLSQFPDLKHAFVTEDNIGDVLSKADQYDFIYLPAPYWQQCSGIKPDLAMNLISFQEMTSEQVEAYVKRLAELNCTTLYSHNRDCSAHNKELDSVSDIIGKYYTTQIQEVLDVPYTALGNKITKIRKKAAKKQEPGTVKSLRKEDYRHLIAKLQTCE